MFALKMESKVLSWLASAVFVFVAQGNYSSLLLLFETHHFSHFVVARYQLT
jgi:hypothetical protein